MYFREGRRCCCCGCGRSSRPEEGGAPNDLPFLTTCDEEEQEDARREDSSAWKLEDFRELVIAVPGLAMPPVVPSVAMPTRRRDVEGRIGGRSFLVPRSLASRQLLEVLLPSLEKRSLSVRLAGPLCGAMIVVRMSVAKCGE